MAALTIRAGAMWNRNVGIQSSLEIVVSVTRPDGTQVTGLTAQNFSVSILDRPPGPGQPVFTTAPPSGFNAVPNPPGVYGMASPQPPPGGWGSEELVIVIDVAAGADHGRALINPIMTKP